MADQLTTPVEARKRRDSPNFERSEGKTWKCIQETNSVVAMVGQEIIHPCALINEGEYEFICSKTAPDYCQKPDNALNDDECKKFCWSLDNCGTKGKNFIEKFSLKFIDKTEKARLSSSSSLTALSLPVFWLTLQLNINAWDHQCRESINKHQKLRVWEFCRLAVFIGAVLAGNNTLLEHAPGQVGCLK